MVSDFILLGLSVRWVSYVPPLCACAFGVFADLAVLGLFVDMGLGLAW
ncbi:hypothetical protein HMPREF9696_00864 [Afipia clevelandensis ATCC 49720]|uniref:Uncharacterized protein n=1 Tax=Afipia clevelandensis ATCC 49720 TaxID=883079 RepID=K8PPY5_9BRAD|nr:hypothetical protein HMPREF9696_00864 [Afipia clevelandensis ATCC 49720]